MAGGSKLLKIPNAQVLSRLCLVCFWANAVR
jgi:hypothetical protein